MFDLVIQLIKSRFGKEPTSPRGIYMSLYESLRKLIESGDLPADTLLPPTRLLCDALQLSRSTTVKAYNLLTENQLIISKHGSGFRVKSIPHTAHLGDISMAQYPGISELGQSFLNNIHLLDSTNDEGLAFTPGLPPVDIFPIHHWQKLSNLYWRTIKSIDLNYSVSSGIGSLKRSIADYLLLSRRIKCDPEQVVIVSGSLQSLYLIGSVLINKGDTVCMENPTFPNVISIFKSLQAHVLPVGVDDEGIAVTEMETNPFKQAKLVHVTPSNHYPVGGKMSFSRRYQLLRWASENDAMIIENDYEHEINNWQAPTESIFSLDKEQRTIYLSTFNRILHPSIRLGYMVLPPHLLPAVKALQMHSHRFVPQSIQVVMTEFINQNLIYKHIRTAIEEAADRKAFFVSQFERLFETGLVLKPATVASFHLLAQMPEHVSDIEVSKALEAKGIVTHALSKCYLGPTKQRGLILGYSCINKSSTAQVLAKMASIVNSMKLHPPTAP